PSPPYALGWPAFGNRPFRHVHVNVMLRKEVVADSELFRMRAGVTERRLRRFLHDITELPCKRESPATCHCGRVDKYHIPTDRCPGQPCCDANFITLQQLFLKNLQAAKELIANVGRPFDVLLLADR